MATDTDEKLPPARPSLLNRARLSTSATALGGMIVGALVGIGVQVGVESTGMLGPSVEALIAEQEANFEDVNTRLDELHKASSDPAVKKSVTELGRLLKRQDDLSEHARTELIYLKNQVATLKEQQLAGAGFAGGADFWLKNGEGVSIGNSAQVFGLVSARSNFADVNLSGTRKRLVVGDAMHVSGANDQACTVFFKQAKPRSDGRVGFDLSCG